MLRVTQSSSPAQAKAYFEAGLGMEDYYSEGQEITGNWGGKLATQLGLEGKVTREAFHDLADNINPQTGERLTARTVANRTVGYDFTFSVPKSVSLLYEYSQDAEILAAFRESVRDTMSEMESEMETRVRTNYANGKQLSSNRTTGNLVYAEFIHTTSRPVGGEPDPHLHSHIYVFNATHDPVENKIKAGQFRNLKHDAPYYQEAFHSRMAYKLQAMGYPVEVQRSSNSKGLGWGITGIERHTVDKFANRTALIEETARAKGLTKDTDKEKLGQLTRENKRKGLEKSDLRELWVGRLNETERATLERLAQKEGGGGNGAPPVSSSAALEYALEHSLERQSVIEEKRLMAVALQKGMGQIQPEQVKASVSHTPALLRVEHNGVAYATTSTMLGKEQGMFRFVKDGQNAQAPLHACYEVSEGFLNADQQSAVQHVLNSRDTVTGIRGAAGAGKTTLMREAVKGIEESGYKVHAFAPSSDARDVLKSEGFEAHTVAKLVQDKEVQKETRNGVIWIDEAGLLGTNTMTQVFAVAKEQNARVVLVGDTAQHRSVEAGDAFRLMQQEGLKVAHVNQIVRQKGSYKEAVAALAEGNTLKGFDALDRLGWVKEINPDTLHKDVAQDYLAAIGQNGNRMKEVLIVSPTHGEGEAVTKEIREGLKAQSLLSETERSYTSLRSLNFTEAEKQSPWTFAPGQVIEFDKRVNDFARGERVTVARRDDNGAVIVTDKKGNERTLPLDNAKGFTVYQSREVALAEGDRVRITKNGDSLPSENGNPHRLNNGSLYRIDKLHPSGDVQLENGWKLSKDFGHLAHGYVTTSHAAQGKTVREVMVVQSSESFAASDKEQFYVSVSRARDKATIYTDSKTNLRDTIERSGERLGASELVSKGQRAATPSSVASSSLRSRLTAYLTTAKDLAKERVTHYKGVARERTASMVRGAGNYANQVKQQRGIEPSR